jgi:predicted flap endonuclease-1-like 5' DNA nuclease
VSTIILSNTEYFHRNDTFRKIINFNITFRDKVLYHIKSLYSTFVLYFVKLFNMTVSRTYIKTKNAYKVTFEVSKDKIAENQEIRLLGDFNSWDWDNAPTLLSDKDAYKVDIHLAPGKKYEYRYCINKSYWVNDDQADAYVSSPFDNIFNCVVDLPSVETAAPAKKAKVTAKPAASKAAPKAATKTTVKAAPKAAAEKAAPKAKATAKAKAVKTTKVEKIDLTKVEGIGPKIAQIFTKNGITTYEALASAKVETLKGLLTAAGSRYQMHDPTTWPKQANLLAAGKLAELKKLQDELKGGKKA